MLIRKLKAKGMDYEKAIRKNSNIFEGLRNPQ